MKHINPHFHSKRYSLLLLFGLLITLITMVLGSNGIASAQVTPAPSGGTVPVTYDDFTNTVYIGANYDINNPAEAPYVNYPSKPGAPKADITIPDLAATLTAQGQPNLLVKQDGGAWLLKANTIISQTARLDVTNNDLTQLRLDSTPTSSCGGQCFIKLVADGGALLINGIKVVSWDGNGPDNDLTNGRSYLLALHGGRMDVQSSEISYLGYGSGDPSGMSWRLTAVGSDGDNFSDPNGDIQTGSTGSILDSDIHDNYYGMYSFRAYKIQAFRNKFHNNHGYGFDPHDYSTGFEVAYNNIYSNGFDPAVSGKHGLIFSRGCYNNYVHDNVVYNNAEHGLMLDRGSNNNVMENNTAYNNGDGIAIFQSSNNVIKNNNLYHNERGIRIDATYFPGDTYDSTATHNTVISNTITANSQYGIYLYERAEQNDIENNTITGTDASGASTTQIGVYIKTGGNTVRNNAITTNGIGVSVVAEAYTGNSSDTNPPWTTPYLDPGHQNTIVGNIISNNNGLGIQFGGAVDSRVGIDSRNPNLADANDISDNGSSGISLGDHVYTDTDGVQHTYSTTKNVFRGNTIHNNGANSNGDGVTVKGANTIKNQITQNSITLNARSGIRNTDGAANNIPAPKITSTTAPTITGTVINPTTNKGLSGVTVEVYRDSGGQGNIYLGTTRPTDANGNWSFTLPPNDDLNNGSITAIAIDLSGNTSEFGASQSGGVGAIYTLTTDQTTGQTTIDVNGQGARVTLPDIKNNIAHLYPNVHPLENQGNGVWQANANIYINKGVTLTMDVNTVSWLKLASQATDIQVAGTNSTNTTSCQNGQGCNYKSFVKLATYGGVINIDGVKVTSWDPQANTYDTDLSNGRAYILAKFNAQLNINNSDLSYLGSADGESYGVAWRDINGYDDSGNPLPQLQTRVTGKVINSNFSYNYIGVYTFQAQNMTFQGNKFHNNIDYGFDPHDYSHDFLVQNNESFENGNHGFIISRGCNNFTFRNNKSYNNHYTLSTENRSAQGFMLDPGSPNSQFPQSPSHDNLFDGNQAYGNDGYGLRILGSINNTVQNNVFQNNKTGITLEGGSTGNKLVNNQVTNNQAYGIYTFGGSDGATITGNTVTGNGNTGIYLKTAKNLVQQNISALNGKADPSSPGAGIATLQDTTVITAPIYPISDTAQVTADAATTSPSNVDSNQFIANTVKNNAGDGLQLKSVTNSTIQANDVEGNSGHGVYLTNGATNNMVSKNTILSNSGQGIRVNGSDSFGNTFTQNKVSQNGAGGIMTTSQANNGIKAPAITSKDGNKVTGTATPNTTVEFFSDDGHQGLNYEMSMQVGADGKFSVTHNWTAPNINATATDANKNTSAFTYNMGTIKSTIFLPVIAAK